MRFCVTAQQNSKELRIKNAWKGVQTAKKPRRVCAAHGANKVKIIFSGGKWIRLQERKARLAKSNPCSAYVGKNTSRLASWVRLQTRKPCAARLVSRTHAALLNFHAFGVKIMRAAGCSPLKREPSVAVSESQNLRFCPSSLYRGVSFEACQKFIFDTLSLGGGFCCIVSGSGAQDNGCGRIFSL